MSSRRTILAVLLCAVVGIGAPKRADGTEAAASIPGRAKPCYVVIAVDVSGSMERVDAPTEDARGRRWTLRDEGQLALLQLLPYVYSDLYVGVCHFSDRVRYMLPTEGTGSVLPWGGNYLDESACRNLVRPAEFMSSFRTNIPRGLDWAMTRIQAARARYGDGPGKVLLLSHGDPQDSSRELEGGGPLLSAGARLAEQNISVYPIIINEASYRPGVAREPLSSSERAAERVMASLAAVTRGRAYRIAQERGFPDILMDVFGLGAPITGDVQISPYDWAVVVVGSIPDSVRVEPETATGATTWQVDPASEIRNRTVASVQWPATIMRRPVRNDAIARLWQGRWALSDDGRPVRVYRIPDFLLETEATPGFPWWIHQQGHLTAQLFDRHNGQRYIPGAEEPSDRDSLAIRFIGQTASEAEAFRVDQGQWNGPSESYTTETFGVETSGAYKLACELLYVHDDVNVPLIGLKKEVQIHPACVGIDVDSTAGETLGELSDTADPVSLNIEGGKQVVFQAGPRGSFNAQPVSGTLHLAPSAQATWPLRKAADADQPATNPITLPEDEERVTGWVEMEVQTPLGPRQFRLPDFELAYQPAPIRLTCSFDDADRALWVGELHRQLLTVSAFPVFQRYVNATRQRFPERLTNVVMRTVDLQSGTVQVTSPGGRLVETPKPTGAKGRTLAAAYSLEADVPIPPADRCEINVTGAIAGLEGAVKTYDVVDPVADGLFTWSVQQATPDARSEPVSKVLYLGEPVRFAAQWRADQNVTGVRFEIPRPRPDGSFFVDLPVTSGAQQASIEQTVPPLTSGQSYPVYVHVTRRVSPDTPPVTIKLRAGQFDAEDRRLVFEELSVGAEAGRDITCHAWEPVSIPLQIAFSGYLPGNPQHAALIEQFKGRCTLTVTSSTGQTHDITEAIEWTTLAADPAPAGQATRCRLEGRAPYTPQVTGRATVELKIAPAGGQSSQADSVRQAFGHLAVRAPRLTIGIHRLTPGGEVPVFDSQAWAQGTGGLSPVTAGFSTRLRLRIRATEDRDAASVASWNITVQVLHRTTAEGQWVIDSSEDLPLNGRDVLVREVQVTKNGQYALEIVGRDAASGQVLTRLRTPVMMTIQQHEVDAVLAPPAWITSRVRRWPFAYRVTLRGASSDLTESALAAQFQLPADDPVWLEASAHVTQSNTTAQQDVLVTSPDVLPVLGSLHNGAVRFRLSAQGLELLNWDYPSVRVLPPVLEKLSLGRLPNGRGVDVVGQEVAWDGSISLWARPVYRVAPELAGQWVREKTVVYLWPDGGDANQVPVALLQQSGAEGGVPGKSRGRVFVIKSEDADQAVEVLRRRARWSFWGWPRAATSRRYALVAAAVYRPQGTPAPATADERTIAEWTEVYSIDLTLPRVIPWCWWFLAALVVYLVLVALLKLFARRPDRLGLDMRLQEFVAVVDPAGLDSPVSISLQPTALSKEIELQKHYLLGRSDGLAQVLRPLAGVLAFVKVLMRRGFLPRRWAWASITPKTGGNVRHVRRGLVCVLTTPFAKTGHGWSSEIGSFDLPGDGQTKSITLDLPYQMEGVTRSMRVSIRIRKMAPGRTDQTAEETA